MIRRLLLVLLLGAAVLALLLWHCFGEARADPIVRRATFELADWPAGARPVQVVLASDIHIGSAAMDAPRLARLVRIIDGLRPDLVVLAGDFIFGHDPAAAGRQEAALAHALGGLRAPLGTIAVLGNHDHWTGEGAVTRALARAGITLLDNAAVARGPLAIGGLDDPYTGHAKVVETMRALARVRGARLFVAHSPDVLPQLPRGAVLLAGHTHCGQVVLPLLGAVETVASPRYTCGIVRDDARTVVVTGGLGASGVPLRLGAPPDLWLLTFGPAR
jgi:uncharacterized protein